MVDPVTSKNSNTPPQIHVLGGVRVPFYYGWIVIGVVFLAEFTTSGMGGSTIPIFFPSLTEDLGWSLTSLLAALTAQSIAGMATAPLVGPLLDKYGAKPVMLFGAISAGIGLILLIWVQEVWQFWILYAIIGALGLNELGRLSGPVVVSKWFIRLRGRAMAIATSGTSVGSMIMAPTIGFLIATIGWRYSFGALGIILMVIMIPPVLLFMKREPEDLGLAPDGDNLVRASDEEGVARSRSQDPETNWTLKEAIRTRTLWILVAALNLAGLAAGALIYLLVPYLSDHGMSTQDASFVFTLMWAGFGISRFIWGFLVERVPVRYCLAAAFLARASGPLILVIVPYPINIVPFLLTYGVFGGSFQLLQSVAFADYFGRRFMGSIQGTIRPLLTLPQLVGPLFLGWLVDLTGAFTYAFIIAGVTGLAASSIALLATPPTKTPSSPSSKLAETETT